MLLIWNGEKLLHNMYTTFIQSNMNDTVNSRIGARYMIVRTLQCQINGGVIIVGGFFRKSNKGGQNKRCVGEVNWEIQI